jgi:hypothetical protein
MRQKMSLGSWRELLDRLAPRYQISSWKEKGRIFDEFVSSTGYHRKHAVELFNHGIPKKTSKIFVYCKADNPRLTPTTVAGFHVRTTESAAMQSQW